MFNKFISIIINTFTHLADTFIQSDLFRLYIFCMYVLLILHKIYIIKMYFINNNNNNNTSFGMRLLSCQSTRLVQTEQSMRIQSL